MSNIVIKAEDISKQYRLGLVGTNTLKGDLQSWWYRMRGKEDPTLKIGHENRLDTSDGEYVWALKDINFEIKQGDVVGIIGKNGAGKSTLLKIISRITTPTTGQIKVKGRIASLLEVGTGFQGDLTGRENIFLNGAILGMKKDEIRRKFDEIVDFSGVGAYIDTPVKRYSSGMYVRLAFAVAAHLEPEILIVDEVLAVGDAEFQKKAIGKMHDISEGQGRTVLFVSHNMTAVRNLCGDGVLIKQGEIAMSGKIADVVDLYLNDSIDQSSSFNEWDFDNAPGTDKIKIKNAFVRSDQDIIYVDSPFEIITEFWCLEEGFPINVSMHLFDNKGECIFNVFTENHPLKKGLQRAAFKVPANLMNDGVYHVRNMFVTKATCHFYQDISCSFEVVDKRTVEGWHGKWVGAVRPTFIQNEYYFIG